MEVVNDAQKVEALAWSMRVAIERTDLSSLPVTFEQFPRGGCGDTALILGRYLKDCGYSGFEYVSASRGRLQDNSWHSHAWLERCGLIVDITGDQFPDFPHRVFVGRESSFHATVEIEDRTEADFAGYDERTASTLAGAYREIRKQLPA